MHSEAPLAQIPALPVAAWPSLSDWVARSSFTQNGGIIFLQASSAEHLPNAQPPQDLRLDLRPGPVPRWALLPGFSQFRGILESSGGKTTSRNRGGQFSFLSKNGLQFREPAHSGAPAPGTWASAGVGETSLCLGTGPFLSFNRKKKASLQQISNESTSQNFKSLRYLK